MTEERTCRCKGQFAMHKPALHADRDGSERGLETCPTECVEANHRGMEHGQWKMSQLEREHERALAAYVPEDDAGEVERLRQWKAEAIEVIRGLQELGRALGLRPGDQITGHSATEAALRLSARAERAEAALARVEALAKYLDTLAPGDRHYAALIREAAS